MGEYSATVPTDAEGLDLGGTKIPYWHYNSEQNKNAQVTFSSLQPKLYAKEDATMSMEAQLSRFVQEQLGSCLQGYRSFLDKGFKVNAGEPEAEVRIGEENVNFYLRMKVEAEQGESEHQMDEFFVKVPLKLKHYYEVAQEITKAQQDYAFLERQGLDLIGTYSGVDAERLPPISEAFDFDPVPKATWNKEQVRTKLQQLLTMNVPLLRYLGATNFYRHDYLSQDLSQEGQALTTLDYLSQKNYDNMILPLEQGNDLEVHFDYFGWEPYFEMLDKGGTIEPIENHVSFDILQMYTHRYYHKYDLSYPVLVTLRDALALDGKGYAFVFALESNIRNNNFVKSGYVQPKPIARTATSMMCDKEKWNSEPVKTIVLDAATKEPVADVQVLFSIPEQDGCLMGTTDAEGELESSYPPVFGGTGSYIKEGYFTNFYPIDTYQYKDRPGIIGYAVADAATAQPAVEIYPYKFVSVTVQKKNLVKCIEGPDAQISSKARNIGLFAGVGIFTEVASLITDATSGTSEVCFTKSALPLKGKTVYEYEPQFLDDQKHRWKFMDGQKSLSEKEKAIITLRRVSDINPALLSEEYVAAVDVQGKEKKEVQLIPGIYEVSALVTNNEELLIPKEERCSGGVLEAIGCGDVEGCCSTFEEQRLDTHISGQLSWNTEKTYLKITPEQLYGAKEITFTVLGFDELGVPAEEQLRVIEDLQTMGKLGEFSALPEMRSALEPRWN